MHNSDGLAVSVVGPASRALFGKKATRAVWGLSVSASFVVIGVGSVQRRRAKR
jgi:hypothetical protein